MRFDGAAIIRKILDHPQTFPLDYDVDEIARKIVVARMKAAADVVELRIIYMTLGAEHFKAVVDHISDAEAKSIVAKVDKENKDAKTVAGAARRVLLIELATGTIEPRAKVVKDKVTTSRGSKLRSSAGKAITSKSTGAVRKRAS